jgi:ParB family chromosome partitioning protein
MAASTKSASPGLGLGNLGNLSGLLKPGATPAASPGAEGPMMIAIGDIDEDPGQPRVYFDDVKLKELAASITERGVKTPISVRRNPEHEGRFIINHGARRYRASIMAGVATVPAFIDADHSLDDQIIENIQRADLTAREIADYVGRELAAARTKAEIARSIGKSAAYVTMHAALLDMPDAIAQAFQEERVRDVTLVSELLKLHRRFADGVEAWLADPEQEITRGSVKVLREYLEAPAPAPSEPDAQEEIAPAAPAKEKSTKESDPDKLKKAILRVEFNGRAGRLNLARRPSEEGSAWIKLDDDGSEFEVSLIELQLHSIIEG